MNRTMMSEKSLLFRVYPLIAFVEDGRRYPIDILHPISYYIFSAINRVKEHNFNYYFIVFPML